MINKKNTLIALIIIIFSSFVFYMGYRSGNIHMIEKDADSKITTIYKEIELSKEKIDSIKKTVKPKTKKITEIEEKLNDVKKSYKEPSIPNDSSCLGLYEEFNKANLNLKNQIKLKDSIIIYKDSTIYDLNNMLKEYEYIIDKKDNHIEIIQNNKKEKRKPIGIGVQSGMTYYDNSIKPYIGVGISYNIIRF